MKTSHILITLSLLLLSHASMKAQEEGPKKWREIVFNIVETSDVHGNFFPYNFIERRPWKGSLARVHSFLKEQRQIYGDNFLYIDNGDILQGQPTAYYYNYVETGKPHLAAEVLNFLGCDIGNIGNHDIEAGHQVYDRWVSQCKFPVLGANIIDTKTGKPYFKPYEIFERDGVKIAVLGMITETVPNWLPEGLWSGLKFENMEECAKKYIKILKTEEHPDVIIGVFHSGRNGHKIGGTIENATQTIAENVDGFDAILYGHDHKRYCKVITNNEDEDVLLINPGDDAMSVSSVVITVRKREGKIGTKEIEAQIVDLEKYPVSEEFQEKFSDQFQAVNDFVNQEIGTIDHTIYSSDAFFGSSDFVDFLHQIQLEVTKADVSFCSPLSQNARIAEGEIHVSDMFNLYNYENTLYTMSLTGQEIKDYLEMSYDLWTNQMLFEGSVLLKIERDPKNETRARFTNPTFNFDSAAGIIYNVDVTKPKGEKIEIISMANGSKFSLTKTYKCAINSYRGNGGGNHLTLGAGIPKEELQKRVLTSTEKDLRYYIMKHIEKAKTIKPKALNNWKFVPEKWVQPALEREKKLLSN